MAAVIICSDFGDHLTWFLRNLYAGQEATVTTGHGVTDWFQIGEGVHQGCRVSPCLFKLYAGYIMINAGLEEAQARIKIAGRNIKNFRYTDDTTFMAKSKEELKSLLMKVKEESEKFRWKFNIQKARMPSSPSAFNLSQHQNFSNESTICIRCPKYWSFSFRISPSNE